MNNRVTIFDTTLRDGEQAPGASMAVPEKIEITKLLARLGVDVIEAGFLISSPAQREAVERIIEKVDGPHQLVDYRIHSISEGADAKSTVTVRVRYGENDFEATAHGTDVLQASAEAYVNALNRLAEHYDTNASVRFVTDGIMKAFG